MGGRIPRKPLQKIEGHKGKSLCHDDEIELTDFKVNGIARLRSEIDNGLAGARLKRQKNLSLLMVKMYKPLPSNGKETPVSETL